MDAFLSQARLPLGRVRGSDVLMLAAAALNKGGHGEKAGIEDSGSDV